MVAGVAAHIEGTTAAVASITGAAKASKLHCPLLHGAFLRVCKAYTRLTEAVGEDAFLGLAPSQIVAGWLAGTRP